MQREEEKEQTKEDWCIKAEELCESTETAAKCVVQGELKHDEDEVQQKRLMLDCRDQCKKRLAEMAKEDSTFKCQ
jgi:hypothetical protein